jgi:hypothetical protein
LLHDKVTHLAPLCRSSTAAERQSNETPRITLRMWCGQPPLPTSGTTTRSDEFGMN